MLVKFYPRVTYFYKICILKNDLDSGKTALQNCIQKITKNNGLKSKKNRSGPLIPVSKNQI